MKYLILLCDGMADRPFPALCGKTPMQLAKKPNMDRLSKTAEIGLCKTVPDGFKPGSDVANLSVIGYDPSVYYTGRSPLEAASIGINLADSDVAIRCNLVTLSEDARYEDKIMLDYSGGDISSAEAEQLIKSVQENLGNEIFSFYAGVSYRHCLVVKDGKINLSLTPPHDISGKRVGEFLSTSPDAAPLIDLMKKSYDILKDHPINKTRIQKGLEPANSVWFWGEGKKTILEDFTQKFGIKGGVISAVDLLKGIAKSANMQTIDVPGATGYIDTNFEGKAAAAILLFENGCDLVYLHLEAPDECGHRGQAEQKVKSIEMIDSLVLAPLLNYLNKTDSYRVLIMPDHPTPLEIKTHSAECVPYLLYDSKQSQSGPDCFTETTAEMSGKRVEKGYTMMQKLLK